MPKYSEPDIVASAIAGIEGILTLPILDVHKRELINIMLWKITQARGKYKTRHQSAGARAAPKGTKLQHEHVTTRKHLVDEIMQSPERAREIAKTAIGCVVTKEEHRELTRVSREQPRLRGWDRYQAASITIVDTDES